MILLSAALIVSLSVNIYFSTQNSALTIENSGNAAKVDMIATLSKAQTSTDSELQRIGESLIYASKQLSTDGITGTQADTILNALAANSTYIINAATENLDNTIVAAAPAEWSYIIGRNVGEQTYLNPNPYGEITPVMTPLVAVQSDMMANIVAVPIFDGDNELVGYISVIFDPARLLNDTITAALAGTDYTTTVMQVDGLMIFDTDPLQQYKNMFTDPSYANYTQLILLGHHVSEYSSGYGTYKFTVDAASPIVVNKECYWTTVSAYGQEWRIALQHSLS
jgi:serine/threonine-protein kinase